MIKCWIEAMRLRTLPVSLAGIVMAVAFNVITGTFKWLPAALCFLFALLAQIASNFANEYYDYRDGLDRIGREGPRRGVTEGDITPQAMKSAAFGTLTAACVVGCTLIYWGGWWLVPVGVLTALGVMAYSAGPYPLSRHGLGEVAVVFFFGLIPVNFTYFIQAGRFDFDVFEASVAMGLMGANVLMVNNYRDYDDDLSVGKRTLCVIMGRRFTASLYAINGLVALFLMWPRIFYPGYIFIAFGYILAHMLLTRELSRKSGAPLNRVLGMTAVLMLAFAVAFLIVSCR